MSSLFFFLMRENSLRYCHILQLFKIEVQLLYNTNQVSGIRQSDTHFLRLYSIYTYYKILEKILVISPVLYHICLWYTYCIQNSLCLLILYPYAVPPSFLSTLITTSLFPISVNLLLFITIIFTSFLVFC